MTQQSLLVGLATLAEQEALSAKVGEVQATPSANTLLARLKAIADAIGGGAGIGRAAITGSTAPYAAGNVIGSKFELDDMARPGVGSGLLQTISLFSKSTQNAALDLLLFHSDPVASTFADKAALAIAAEDFNKLLGVIRIDYWRNLGGPSIAEVDALAKIYKLSGTTMYGVLVARSAMTLASATDLEITACSLRD